MTGSRAVGRWPSLLLPAVLLALAVACSDDNGTPTDPPDPPGDRVPTSLELQTQQIEVDDAGTVRVSATVRDQDGEPFASLPAGTSIDWSVGDASVAAVQAVGSGLEADITGERPGTTEVEAALDDLSAGGTVTVRQVATELTYVSGDEQEADAQSPLAEALVVQVIDRHGDGVPGVEVAFEAVAGGGGLSPSTAQSDDEGIAQSVWTLGPDEGEQTARASVEGLAGSPRDFLAMARPAVATGSVTGVVTAANGVTPIQGALVRLMEGGAAASSLGFREGSATDGGPQTTTDSEGRYTLEGVPEGDRTLLITRGVFRAEVQVTVVAGEVVEAPLAPLDSDALAYVPGDFDNIQSIVRDELGTELDELDPFDLANPEITSQYRFIFVNCGVEDWEYLDDPAVRDNLLDFIASGGALYVSDLELPLVSALFPDHIQSMGWGEEGTVQADVVSDSLRAFIGGQSTVSIVFNLDGWASITQLSNTPDVLLQGEYQSDGPVEGPLAVAIEHGEGHLVYTSFHTNAAATDDQISVLRYFIYGFGDAGLAAHGPAVATDRGGVRFEDYAVPATSRPHRLPERHRH